jgi:DNA-directed RNA polymerase sigma subunit (sigma70/sigma32)
MLDFKGNKEFYEYFIKLPDLNKEEEQELISKMKLGDNKAREKLILYNLKTVIKYIKACPFNSRFDENDLFQEGVISIIQALNSYDPDRGTQFKTYIIPKIKKALSTYVNKNHFTLKVPLYLKEIFYKIKKIENEYLLTDNYKFPSVKTLSSRLNISEETIKKCLEVYDNYFEISQDLMEEDYAS